MIELAHHTFTVERVYPQSPAKVFRAHADTAAKRRWFAESTGFIIDSYSLDFKVGGWERTRFRYGEDGPPMTNDCVYHEIAANERMVFSYAMTIGGAPLSVSLSTTELHAEGKGTRLVFTEQIVHYGEQDIEGRKDGTRQLFERLAAELNR
ncbi:hypothetical protein sos41_37010 [Alphaproteobacteria bacterium SO-S41]|nr:hypothetical protein sos41_37010 [Alphaproteobacteria bacterium SO-S41]